MNADQKTVALTELLAGNPYPGRGLALGMTPDGNRAVCVYFIMGRSRNSRNRIFAPTEDGIRTQAYDETLVEDPSLIIYRAVRTLDRAAGRCTIVTNGNQTDTIYDGLLAGKTFEESLEGRTFEPDAPNYTPRISGLLEICGGRLPAGAEADDDAAAGSEADDDAAAGIVRCQIGILKTKDGDPQQECREFFTYSPAESGTGHFISTYVTDGDPLPSFEGAPKAVAIPGNVEDWAEEIWQALDKDNRISLYVRAEEIGSGNVWECVINAHDE